MTPPATPDRRTTLTWNKGGSSEGPGAGVVGVALRGSLHTLLVVALFVGVGLLSAWLVSLVLNHVAPIAPGEVALLCLACFIAGVWAGHKIGTEWERMAAYVEAKGLVESIVSRIGRRLH